MRNAIGTIGTLIIILFVALCIRLALAPLQGHEFDIHVNEGWMRSAVELGMVESYSAQVGDNMLPNYPPVSLFVFAAAGHIYRSTIADTFDLDSTALRVYIKLPAIAADLLICVLLFFVLSRWKNEKTGLLGALIYALNPASIFDSAFWGQTDSIYTLLLLCAVAALSWKRWNIATVMITLALLTKLQAIILVPLFGFLLLKNLRLALRCAIVSITTIFVVLLPFVLKGKVDVIMNVYKEAIGYYARISHAAFNFWWSLLGSVAWERPDTDLIFNLLSYRTVGILLFSIAIVIILFVCRRGLKMQDNTEALFVGATLLAAAFFLFSTQMHERYLFPFIALGVPLCFINRSFATLYWSVCILFWLNMMRVLEFSQVDKALFNKFHTLDDYIAYGQVFAFLLMITCALKRYRKQQIPSS